MHVCFVCTEENANENSLFTVKVSFNPCQSSCVCVCVCKCTSCVYVYAEGLGNVHRLLHVELVENVVLVVKIKIATMI